MKITLPKTNLRHIVWCISVMAASTVMQQASAQFSPLTGGSRGGASYAGRTYQPSENFRFASRAGSVIPSETGSFSEEPMMREAAYGRSGRAFQPISESIETGPMEMGDEYYGEEPVIESRGMGYSDGCGCGGDCDGSCGGCGFDGCDPCNTCVDDDCVPLCIPRFKHLSVFAGVHGFKGPRDNGFGNNFGFQEGLNVSGRLPLVPWPCLGYQLGYQSVQSRLHGDVATFSETTRIQHFATAAIFHRRCVGLQWGVAYDIMRDDLQQDLDFSQLRTEISIVNHCGTEIGFMGMFHTNDTGLTNVQTPSQLATYSTVDQYTLFIRKHFCDCAEGRIWGGMTDDNDGLFGADFLVSLDDRWSIQGGFNYLIPEQDTLPGSAVNESWNIGMNLVWHYGCDGCSSHSSPFRPLFNVADNGTMFVDRY